MKFEFHARYPDYADFNKMLVDLSAMLHSQKDCIDLCDEHLIYQMDRFFVKTCTTGNINVFALICDFQSFLQRPYSCTVFEFKLLSIRYYDSISVRKRLSDLFIGSSSHDHHITGGQFAKTFLFPFDPPGNLSILSDRKSVV